MPQHVLIVGGGVGGTIVANLLARHLEPIDATVTLIESTGKHAYMPGWLYLPFNHEVWRATRSSATSAVCLTGMSSTSGAR